MLIERRKEIDKKQIKVDIARLVDRGGRLLLTRHEYEEREIRALGAADVHR